MNSIIDTASRIGGLYSNHLRTLKGEMEVLAEIDKFSNDLRNAGCDNAEISTISGASLKLIAKIPANRDLETELHRKYGEFRKHGEWSYLRDEQVKELESYLGNLIKGKWSAE